MNQPCQAATAEKPAMKIRAKASQACRPRSPRRAVNRVIRMCARCRSRVAMAMKLPQSNRSCESSAAQIVGALKR